MTALKINRNSYKIGLDQIEELEQAMRSVLQPVLDNVNDKVYWNDRLDFEPSEYKSRDGFMPFASNCGGLELVVIIPKCEEYKFPFIEFGECQDCEKLANDKVLNSHKEIAACGYAGQECASDSEGYLDAKLRLWCKFEGLDDNGVMSFYLVLSGGNGDAPYFRENYSDTYFETEFEAKSLAEFKRVAATHVKKLMKVLKGR